MKTILTAIIGLFILGTISSEAICQESSVTRNYDFQIGDVLSSSTGTLTGELKKASADDDNLVGVFMGANSNHRSSVVRSEGVVEVKVSNANGAIKAGDVITTGENGLAIKLVKSSVSLGVALSEPVNGKVRVRLDIGYAKAQ